MTILEQIKAKHKSSAGHCGIYLTDFGVEIKTLKIELNKLHRENKISVHDGIHGDLIMLKKIVDK